jgi:hypothetical protein
MIGNEKTSMFRIEIQEARRIPPATPRSELIGDIEHADSCRLNIMLVGAIVLHTGRIVAEK